jgi:hypothetical protein
MAEQPNLETELNTIINELVPEKSEDDIISILSRIEEKLTTSEDGLSFKLITGVLKSILTKLKSSKDNYSLLEFQHCVISIDLITDEKIRDIAKNLLNRCVLWYGVKLSGYSQHKYQELMVEHVKNLYDLYEKLKKEVDKMNSGGS